MALASAVVTFETLQAVGTYVIMRTIRESPIISTRPEDQSLGLGFGYAFTCLSSCRSDPGNQQKRDAWRARVVGTLSSSGGRTWEASSVVAVHGKALHAASFSFVFLLSPPVWTPRQAIWTLPPCLVSPPLLPERTSLRCWLRMVVIFFARST